jgi:hypothetical protein
MTGFENLTIDQLETFIEVNKKHEKYLGDLLLDAKCALLAKQIEAKLAYAASFRKEQNV